MSERNKRIIKTTIFLMLLVWFCFLVTAKIDLSTADLGRHIKNGEWVVANHFSLLKTASPLHQNFFSYTYPDFPFVNHHWASGLVYYLIYSIVRFSGLSIFNTSLSALAFLVFFCIAYRESNFTYASLFSFFLIPLMAERREIRPETFSVLFAGIFFLLLWLWNRKEISARWLFLLPVLMAVWVNLHIYFFLGFLLIGAFLVSDIGKIFFSRLTDLEFGERVQKIKWLLMVTIFTLPATLANPSGVAGAIHPLTVYKNYGYTVLEEKSLSFLENYGIMNPNFTTVKAVLILLAIGFLLLLAVNRKKISVGYLLLAIFFGAIGFAALRNFSLLGFFALPLLTYVYANSFIQKTGEINLAKENGAGILFIAVVLLGLYGNFQFVSAHEKDFGIGLKPDVQKAAEFIKGQKIAGPIFNDYDIGGYLIFNLPDEEKVFVDNRPEVYPNSFFSDVYKPMQSDPDIFKKTDQEYNFNAVVFYRNDITPWAQSFFQAIQENSDWVLVYQDDYAIIYLKQNAANKDIIERYKI